MTKPATDGGDAIDQWDMVHELPPARLVDRIEYLCEAVRGRHVVHLGFADARCATFQADRGAWLHATLAGVASELVGLDIDEEGVAAGRAAGYEAYCVDCRDPEAVAALGLAPADVVVIGELIEHLDDPGSMLEAVKPLVAAPGVILITTPNGHGLFNVCAAIAGRELNHPDHVSLYSWYTLSNLLARARLEDGRHRGLRPDPEERRRRHHATAPHRRRTHGPGDGAARGPTRSSLPRRWTHPHRHAGGCRADSREATALARVDVAAAACYGCIKPAGGWVSSATGCRSTMRCHGSPRRTAMPTSTVRMRSLKSPSRRAASRRACGGSAARPAAAWRAAGGTRRCTGRPRASRFSGADLADGGAERAVADDLVGVDRLRDAEPLAGQHTDRRRPRASPCVRRPSDPLRNWPSSAGWATNASWL